MGGVKCIAMAWTYVYANEWRNGKGVSTMSYKWNKEIGSCRISNGCKRTEVD